MVAVEVAGEVVFWGACLAVVVEGVAGTCWAELEEAYWVAMVGGCWVAVAAVVGDCWVAVVVAASWVAVVVCWVVAGPITMTTEAWPTPEVLVVFLTMISMSEIAPQSI